MRFPDLKEKKGKEKNPGPKKEAHLLGQESRPKGMGKPKYSEGKEDCVKRPMEGFPAKNLFLQGGKRIGIGPFRGQHNKRKGTAAEGKKLGPGERKGGEERAAREKEPFLVKNADCERRRPTFVQKKRRKIKIARNRRQKLGLDKIFVSGKREEGTVVVGRGRRKKTKKTKPLGGGKERLVEEV